MADAKLLLRARLGRDPTIGELSGELGMDHDQLLAVLRQPVAGRPPAEGPTPPAHDTGDLWVIQRQRTRLAEQLRDALGDDADDPQ